VRDDPDFLSLEPSNLTQIEETRLWVEVKVFRQLLALLPVSVPKARDVANVIGINTRKIGTATDSADLHGFVFRCFNSYLLSTINARDPRSTYYLFHQYRLLAEHFLDQDVGATIAKIGRRFQFYGLLGYETGQGFLLEVAAHDLVELIRLSLERDGKHLLPLLDRLLEMDQVFRSETQEQSLTGVRRAQLIAASMLAAAGYQHDLERLLKDVHKEEPSRLLRIYTQLIREEREQYWEFTDRGTNFNYLRPHLQQVIDGLSIEP
jgi:hypothetical protein